MFSQACKRLATAAKFLLVILAAGLAACSHAPRPTIAAPAIGTVATAPRQRQGQARFPTLDDEFAAIAAVEPSFAGMFLDSIHAPVVLLTDVTRLAAVRSAGVDASLANRGIPTANLRVQTAAYNFAILARWLDSAEAILNLSGLVFSGIDAMHNRLHI
jgi:hypothetical protein